MASRFHTKGILEAIKIAGGSQEKLGKLVNRSQQMISISINAKKLPYKLAFDIHKATGVSLSKLLPEFQGEDESAA
jgi:hypothetical protein